MALKWSLYAMGLLALSLSAWAAEGKPPSDKDYVSYDQAVIAFTHATVVDGTGSKALHDQTLVIDHGRIAALGKTSKVKLPDGATVIDAQGKTLLPGLVMVHEHMFLSLIHI